MAEIKYKTIIRLSNEDIVAVDYVPLKPQIVYHYTSIKVLSKILETKKLRLTNLRKVCDKSEYLHGLSLLINAVSDYEYSIGIKPEYKIGRDFYDKIFAPNDLYVMCFTENGDDLNFWNSKYVDKSQPIAIGFYREALCGEKTMLNRCVYDDRLPFKIDSNIYNILRNVYDGISTETEDHNLIRLTFGLAHFKQKAFVSENEWRIISPNLSDTHNKDYLNKNSHIFIDLNLKSIAKIVVGPGFEQFRNLDLVNEIAKQHGLRAEIDYSRIPLEL